MTEILSDAQHVVMAGLAAYDEEVPQVWEHMSIVVELYGIPRARAGVDRTQAEGNCLGEVLLSLSARFPGLATSCINGNQLKSGLTANLHGERFISTPDTPLQSGDTILLMSLDAGG